jgi:Ca2+/Na+ antiporter
MEFLVWLRGTEAATAIRESESVWGYPTILFLHTFGMAILVGLISAIDLRLLGVGRQLPLAPLQRLFPLLWAGFSINVVTGSILFAIDGPKMVQNPAFPVKLALIALGMTILLAGQRRVFRRRDRKLDRILAALSLVVWAGAVTAGRFMAYVGKQE